MPLLTVLLLLTGEHLEEVDGGLTRGMGPLKECISVFFKLREEDADRFWHSLISRAENVWRNRQGSSQSFVFEIR